MAWIFTWALAGIACQAVGQTLREQVEDAFLRGDYESTVVLAERALEESPGALEVRFLRGAALFELGDEDASRDELNRYLQSGGAFVDDARAMIADLDARPHASPPQVHFLVQAGVVYDSRILTPTNEEPYFTENDDVALRARLAIDLETDSGLLARYRAYLLHYLDVDAGNRVEQSLGAGARWGLGQSDLEWTLVGEHSLRDGREEFRRIGTRGEFAHLVHSNQIAWVAGEVGEDSFPDADGFDGAYVIGSAGWEQYFTRASLFWDVYAQWHDADWGPAESQEFGGGVAASVPLSTRTSGGLALRWARVTFDELDPFLDASREDTLTTARLWVSLPALRGLQLVPSVEFVSSDSNLAFADYDEQVAAIDLIWSRW